MKNAVAGIIGLGYVGIPLMLRASAVGINVIGFDISKQRVSELEQGKSPIKHISDNEIAEALSQGFEPTSDFSRISECKYIIICVPTPLSEYRDPDLSYIISTMDSISPYIRKGQMLSLESTTWPGTTAEVLHPYIERAGLTVGTDFYLVYSPEREDPGNPNFTTRTIPKVVGGHTSKCLEVGVHFYKRLIDNVVPISSTQAAEMVKLLENIHRAVNIGLMNEIKVLTDRMGLDIFEIVDAAATKPFGFTPYYPGPGIGGHCIPIDPFYLTWKARQFNMHTRFIELAGEINAGMPSYVVDKIIRALSDRGKSLKGAKILLLGMAYKRNIDDMRESPSLDIFDHLEEWGAELSYHDPNVPHFHHYKRPWIEMDSVPITQESLPTFDAVVLLTDHSRVDYDLILEQADLIIDTRGKYRVSSDKVVKA